MRLHPYLETYAGWVGPIATSGPLEHARLDASFEQARRSRFPDEPALRFVPCPKKPRRRGRRREVVDPCDSYDGRITRDREVPTRTGDLHDACNFVVWLAFPRAKRAIHERQLRARERWIEPGSTRIPGARTREQDALTLFDEGGVLLLGDGAVEPGYELPDSLGVVAFGHALLEHFASRDTPIAATAMRLCGLDARDPDAIDRAVASRVSDPAELVTPGLDALVLLDAHGRARVVDRRP